MSGESVEVEIRSLFADLKTDKVESLLIQLSDWGLNIRMFLNGDNLELDLIKNFKGYEVTFVDHSDKEPVQLNEVSELIQILNITQALILPISKSLILSNRNTCDIALKRKYGRLKGIPRTHLLMHVKDPWIRSILFAVSGLMLAVGFIKMKDQVQSLMVITAGLVSLAVVISKDPDQDLK